MNAVTGTTSRIDFLKEAIRLSDHDVKMGREIGLTGLGCMDRRSYAASMQVAEAINKIIKKAQAEIESVVAKTDRK
jgi:hypothetical protein